MNYKEFFNQKKVVVIGLGPHGEMLADIKFLLRNKADVTLYDIRSEKRQKEYISDLKDTGLENYFFGKVDADALLNYDLILLSPEISKKSLFLKKSLQAEKTIEFPDTLFFKLSPPITLIGVLGSYGKSAVASMIYAILKKSFASYKDQGLFFIDPDSDYGALTHLKKIKKGDVVLARITENLVSYYYDIHISPHVAVITSLIPFDILDFQTYNNFIVAPDEVVDAINREKNFPSKAKMLRTRSSLIPADWNVDSKILHTKENAALVLQTSELFKVPTEIIKDFFQSLPIFRGSIELVKKVTGVEFYNDANAVNPRSTLSALRSIATGKDTILILGGAYTGYDYSELLKNIPQYVLSVILIHGSGSLGIRRDLMSLEGVGMVQALSVEDAVKEAYKVAKKGNKVLFSPSFEAVGIDISRKERGEKFVKAVRGL